MGAEGCALGRHVEAGHGGQSMRCKFTFVAGVRRDITQDQAQTLPQRSSSERQQPPGSDSRFMFRYLHLKPKPGLHSSLGDRASTAAREVSAANVCAGSSARQACSSAALAARARAASPPALGHCSCTLRARHGVYWLSTFRMSARAAPRRPPWAAAAAPCAPPMASTAQGMCTWSMHACATRSWPLCGCTLHGQHDGCP